MPDVSVIIPTYNRRDFLPEAVASCFEGNDGLAIEVVVVDDGSTDGTREWLRSREDERIRPVFREHEGAQQARNAGLEAARGKTIKFLDSDDYLYPGVLDEQYEALTEAGADVCYGPIDIVDGDGNVQGHKPNPAVEDLLGGIATGTVTTYPHVFLYRAEFARRERWRPEVPYHQDTVYALDVAARNPSCVQSHSPIGTHRTHQKHRITTQKKEVAAPEKIERKFVYLIEAYRKREQCSTVDDELRNQIARGLWKEAHKIAPHDLDRFVSMYDNLNKVYPKYMPKRVKKVVKILDKLVNPKWTEVLINPLRKYKIRREND